MARLIQMPPEQALAVKIANEMLDSGASMNEVRVRVNRECPELDRKTQRRTLMEIERERGSLPGAVHSSAQAVDSQRAGEDAQQSASG